MLNGQFAAATFERHKIQLRRIEAYCSSFEEDEITDRSSGTVYERRRTKQFNIKTLFKINIKKNTRENGVTLDVSMCPSCTSFSADFRNLQIDREKIVTFFVTYISEHPLVNFGALYSQS